MDWSRMEHHVSPNGAVGCLLSPQTREPRISNGPLRDEPGRCVWEISQNDKCLRATGSLQKLSSHCRSTTLKYKANP